MQRTGCRGSRLRIGTGGQWCAALRRVWAISARRKFEWDTRGAGSRLLSEFRLNVRFDPLRTFRVTRTVRSGSASIWSLARQGVQWHQARMDRSNLTQGEQNAIRRVSAGAEVGTDMWQDLFRKGLVERRLGKRALTDSGRAALGALR
jgi:hypothetical protein